MRRQEWNEKRQGREKGILIRLLLAGLLSIVIGVVVPQIPGSMRYVEAVSGNDGESASDLGLDFQLCWGAQD